MIANMDHRWILIGLIICLAALNLAAFLTFGADKKRAKRHEWRISEKVLFLLAALGGSAGAVIGMLVFRHKTKKWYFRIGIPLILIAETVLLAVILLQTGT